MTARDITFESGYRRLQEIAERLNSDEVPVHEMCDLFAEGTGLHQALSGYLRDQRARVEAIERGEGVQAFRIVPPEGAGVERGIDAAPRAGAASGRPPADGAPRAGAANGRPPSDAAPPAAAPPSRSDELELP